MLLHGDIVIDLAKTRCQGQVVWERRAAIAICDSYEQITKFVFKGAGIYNPTPKILGKSKSILGSHIAF